MIRAAANLVKKLTAGESIHNALAQRAQSHLDVWRDLVRAHATGKAVDISKIDETGSALRLRDIATAFSNDVTAFQEEADRQAQADKALADADAMQARSDEAQRELTYFIDNQVRLKQEAQAADWGRVAAARYASEAMFMRRANPRIWPDAFADEGEDVARNRMAKDELEEAPIPAPRASAGSVRQLDAVWET